MRKGSRNGGRGRSRPKLSLYERLQLHKQAQAQRDAANKAAGKQISAASTEDDIEITFSDDESDSVHTEPPRKSPRKSQNGSPNSKARPDTGPSASSCTVVEAAEGLPAGTRDAQAKDASNQPSHSARPPLCKPAQHTESRSRRRLIVEGQPPILVPQERSAEQAPGEASAERPAPRASEPAAAQSCPQLSERFEELDPSELAAGLQRFLPALRDRVLDPTGGPEANMPLRPSLYKVQQRLEALLGATVDVPGENNSILLIGPRGTGKTLVVERAAANLTKRFNTNAEDPRVGFVRLTGLAHADERAAFREIARQLCRIFQCQFSRQASLEDNLGFLRDMLRELHRSHKVVIFVLDELDMFARKQKQTLLYNLLDAMQASSMQAGVVGMSCRSDVTEMLEKRVKSRFSYRRQLILDPSTSDFDNRDEGPAAIIRSLLTVVPGQQADGQDRKFAACFNRSVAAALGEETVKLQLQRLCNLGQGCPRALGNIAIQALSFLGLDLCLLKPEHLLDSVNSLLASTRSQVESVKGLSILELFLLVAMFRLQRKGIEPANFEMAFDEYSSLRRGGSYRGVDETAPRPSAFRAFERLLSSSLIVYSDARHATKGYLREFLSVTLSLTLDELEEGLAGSRNCPPVLLEWLKKDAVASHAAIE